MTCAEFQARFPEYAAGRVSETTAALLEAHLENCPACEAALAHESPPLMEAGTLSRSVAPGADLWPEIRDRMTRSRGGLRARLAAPRWVLAAAALVLMVLSSGVTALLSRPTPAVGAIRVSSNVEAEYAAASRDLVAALDSARVRLSPGAVATIERSLHIIDAALLETRQALAQDPGNAALSELVVAAWRQKLDLLRRATEMSKPS